MGMDHVFAGRPDENREASVLGSDEGDRVALIVDELGGGDMARPTQLGRVHYGGTGSDDGLRHDQLLDPRRALPPADLGPEGEDFVFSAYDGGAIHGGKARHHGDAAA